MAEIEAKELPQRGKEILTMDTMFARWIVERGEELRSGKDIKWQIKTLLRFIGGSREIAEFGNKDVNGFVQDAKLNDVGSVAINRCLERLRGTMNYAAKRWEATVRVIDWTEFRQEEEGAREVYLSPEEARRLMDILPGHIALSFAFTLYTGARLNELSTLVWERIDTERGVAMVATKAKGKKVIMRPLWLSQKALVILRQLDNAILPIARRLGCDDKKVFNLSNRRKHWEAARAQIGRKDVTWHDLRAMTASWSRQHARADITLISRALGHSDTKVTERYARVVDREIVEMLDQLPDITPLVRIEA